MQRKIFSTVFKQILMCVLLLPMIASAHLIRIDSTTPFPASVSTSSTTEATYRVFNISSITLEGIQDKSIFPAGMSLLNSSTCSSTATLSPGDSCTLELSLVAPATETTLSGGILQERALPSVDGVQLLLPSISVTGAVTQYTVTPSNGANGSISPNTQQTVNSGANLTFTAAPASGFEVDQWLLDGDGVQSGGLTYDLNNITADHSIEVTFLPSSNVPTVTGLSPNFGSGFGNDPVIITGTHFIPGATVKFGGVLSKGAATVNSSTSITATSPGGSGSVHVTVTTSAGTSATSSADVFTYGSLRH